MITYGLIDHSGALSLACLCSCDCRSKQSLYGRRLVFSVRCELICSLGEPQVSEALPWLWRSDAGRPLTAEVWIQSQANPIRVTFVMDKVPLAQIFLSVLRCSPVSSIPSMLQTHHHNLNTVLIRRTSGRNLGTFKESNALSYTMITSRSIRWVRV